MLTGQLATEISGRVCFKPSIKSTQRSEKIWKEHEGKQMQYEEDENEQREKKLR